MSLSLFASSNNKLRALLVPTTTKEYQSLDAKYRRENAETLEMMQNRIETLRVIVDDARTRRTETLELIGNMLPNASQEKIVDEKSSKPLRSWSSDTSSKERLLQKFCAEIKETDIMRNHLNELLEERAKFEELVNTQATAYYADYRGLRHWAQSVFPAVDYFSTALIALSTVGAGLVYSTIFGATRGNIGLMSFTFPLFTIGFLIPAVIQIVLRWASQLSREVRFASQAFWRSVIIFFLGFATIAVMTAITILNVTIFFLDPRLTEDAASTDPTSGGTISQLPGIIAFAFSGVIFILLFLGFLLCVFAAGLRQTVLNLVNHPSPCVKDLEEFTPV